MRDTAQVLEEHRVDRARAAGWTWAEIAAVLEVSAPGDAREARAD